MCIIDSVYVDVDGEEMVSPLEYETLGLLGSNCGLTDPDHVARLNAVCNDLGIDTIEIGGMLGALMDAGHAEFGDVEFLGQALDDIAQGNERGRLLAQSTAQSKRQHPARKQRPMRWRRPSNTFVCSCGYRAQA